MLIIDCHGHYTTAPDAHQQFRDKQLARLKDPNLPMPSPARISDDEIRETIEKNQLKLQRDRGADITLFSPRASAMAHHVGDEATSSAWTRGRCPERPTRDCSGRTGSTRTAAGISSWRTRSPPCC